MFFKCISNLIFLFSLFLRSSGQVCDSSGLRCINCTDYQKCNGGIFSDEVISCKTGDGCEDEFLKQCQMKLNCYAGSECTEVGIFPDLLIESNYFVCLSDGATGFVKYDFACPEGSFFDKSTSTCVSKSITSVDLSSEAPTTGSSSVPSSEPSSIPPTEPSSIPPTESPSTPPTESPSTPPTESPSTFSTESHSTPPTESPSTFSTASPSTPPTESPSTFSTESPSTPPTESPSTPPTEPPSTPPTEPSSISTSIEPSTPTPSTESSLTTTATTPVTSTQPPILLCVTSGIFPNPTNCKMYFRCSTSLKIFQYICPGNSYFNENLLKCSLIVTPACQEQILKNSTTLAPLTTIFTLLPTTTSFTTTTLPSSTTPTTTTTSTTLLPTTTTLALITTPTSIPATTFSTPTPLCLASGIIANPVDCKSYYRCSVSGQIFTYVCPRNTYFNEIAMRCSLVITPRCKSLIQG